MARFTSNHCEDNFARILRDVKRTYPRDKDTCLLSPLHYVCTKRIDAIRAARQYRIGILGQLNCWAENGKIAVIESGMDCDGVSYDGRRHLIDASLAALQALEASISEWADGPFSLRLQRPSVPARYASRDNVAEAHEDGHAHSITRGQP